ncbi:MAG: HlyD family efflux transporter periplasmic adaptor subunit [Chloroflexi bacterium]|nr:HlyD family efflux transporter periplasmic adaptor subunit [Chloroflexota bacterium]
MMKKFIFPVLVGLTLILAACGGQPTVTPVPTVLPPVKDSSTISAEGKVEPLQLANLSFAIGGEVTEVLVKEGDMLKAGDVIARLDVDAVRIAITRAEAGVAAAKASEAKYKEGLPQQIASAESDVQAAQAQIVSASAKRNNSADIASAEAALKQAQLDQKAAEDAYKKVLDKKLYGPTEEAQRLVVQNAQRATEAAQIRLNQIRRGSLNDQSNAAGIAAAEARLAAAETNLKQLQAEASGQPNPTYAAAIQQAEAALASAQTRLADAELKAPFAGTLAQLNIKVGETVAPGAPIAVLADLSGWQVETDDLTEIKVPGVSLGQSVTVKADALPGVELKGQVTSIGTLFQEKSGDVVYPVKIKLLDADPKLRWGMTVVATFAAPASTSAAKPSSDQALPGGIAAEGKLLPLQSATLSFNTTGEVAEVLVKEGDVIKSGDVIARLSNESLKTSLTEAEAALAVIKANQADYRSSLPKQIAAAEAEIKAAQSQAAGAAAGRNNTASIKDLESRLAQLKYQLQQMQTGLDQLFLYDLETSTAANDLRQQIDNTQQSIKATEAQIAALKYGSPTDQAANAQITAASASEAAALARLAQLQAELAGTSVDTFAAQIQQAEAAISAARLALADTELKAPFAGTIAQLNINLGERVSAGVPAVTLADIGGWLIETSDVTELKVPDLQVGQSVVIKIDALPELALKGQVESISTVSQLKSGDVVYPVKIKVLDNDPQLRWGMTVAVGFEK